jgi:hypothetical protein
MLIKLLTQLTKNGKRKMENDEFFKKSKFTKDWIDLKIITPEALEELKAIHNEEMEEIKQKYEKDGTLEEYSWRFSCFDDEHQRWRAFVKFLEINKELSSEIFKQLYELGNNDPDEMMGGSMMKELLDRKDCPLDLLNYALESDRVFLVKTANRAILRRNSQS